MILFYLILFLRLTPFFADIYQDRFEKIYSEKMWGSDEEDVGFSGGGSLLENAWPFFQYFNQFLKDHHIKSVVDLGCGDWTLFQHINWDGIDYIGYDVVSSVIEKNILKYSSPHIHFIHGNFLSVEIPQADLLVCKHVLQHMPNQDIFSFLKLMPKFKHCLILDAKPSNGINIEHSIETKFPFWDDRGIDLTLPPFNIKGQRVLEYPQIMNHSGIDILTHFYRE